MLQMVPWLKSGVPGEVVTVVDVSLVEMFRRLRRNADGADTGTLAGCHAGGDEVCWAPKNPERGLARPICSYLYTILLYFIRAGEQ